LSGKIALPGFKSCYVKACRNPGFALVVSVAARKILNLKNL
jgi:hypothetical protein